MLGRKPPGPGWKDDGPPDDEPSLVPRRPRPTASPGTAMLEPPGEPDEIDARGREAS